MPINAKSSRITLMFYWCLDPALIGIKRNWLELIGIDQQWSALGIDRESPDTSKLINKTT